ncbi:SEFIR domain-containing protein [Fontibacillus panacisegetis]|uniref:SEFIR domain-containing protein n=2 Tax=Fontibacillus panacisegetis TaxID=670482 RepID=A0A1G7HYF8_9BACL|nr:TIR domain-containing protein [Fontibacillus panacisegetis]SDF05435.1 SEFIR domain-containing protein [Fontibacillus panacisegetis]
MGLMLNWINGDLKEGYDKYALMENMVTSSDIDKVLIICDKGYKEKANENKGGVGTEKLLITPEVFDNVEQSKFIPIVAERDENGKEHMPTFIKSRIYIDLSDVNTFEENYEKLVRTLYNAPLYRKPPLGKRPVFLNEETINQYKTTNIIRQIKSAIDSNPRRIKSLARAFTELYLEELDQLKLEHKDFDPNEIDEKIVEKINASIPLRDNFIEVAKLLSENDIIESDWIIDLFEKLYVFTEFNTDGTYYEIQFDHYKFLIHEMFLYTCAIMLKYEQYQPLSEILTSRYYLETKRGNREVDFVVFRFYLRSLDSRNERLGLRKISLQAQMLLERTINECDILLHYFSSILLKDRYSWFPITYIYRENDSNPIKFLAKLKSKRKATQVLKLFNVASIEELQALLGSYSQENGYGYRGAFYNVPILQTHIKPEEIGINP